VRYVKLEGESLVVVPAPARAVSAPSRALRPVLEPADIVRSSVRLVAADLTRGAAGRARAGLLDLHARRDARRLRARAPHLWPSEAAFDHVRAALEPAYRDYVDTVSEASWALSLETATYLGVLCDVLRPTRLLDTGSGFSSFVFRRYARAADGLPVEVVSIDDDPAWLTRTASFLRRQGLPTEQLATWPSGLVRPDSFDLVCHDLASGALRDSSMGPILQSVARPGGAVVIDDAQVHGLHARSEARVAGLTLFSLRARTLDRFGRFALLGLP
jgi:predicted O-methyltransferase YrrM